MADKGTKVIYITKKAKAVHAHHGGAWKVAYADFVTAMMALFMVLWLLAQTDQVTKQKLSEYFRTGMFQGAPSVLPGGTGILQNGFLDVSGGTLQLEQSALQTGLRSIKEALDDARRANSELEGLIEHMDIKLVDEGLLIQILDGGDELIFDLSSADLKPRLRQLLEVMAPVLEKLDNDIQLHGHTDARPFPAKVARNNWDLSYERASAARRELEEHGLTGTKIVGVFAHGSSMPYVKDDPWNPKNRRLAILALRATTSSTATRPAPGGDVRAPSPVKTGYQEPPKPHPKSPS
ncbi:MAG TPA: flagellar motor protein MotB [Polyangiaceae bacterium]|nr:flagellar motor protein MotB [Polyangiaceae bacterium]